MDAQYVQIEGPLGGQIDAFALTQKLPGMFNWYSCWSPPQSSNIGQNTTIPQDIAFRFLVYLSSLNGTMIALFGGTENKSFYSLNIGRGYYGGTEWSLSQYHSDTENWTNTLDSIYVDFFPNQWHTIEVRMNGQSARFFLDHTMIGKQALFDYELGWVGFGAALSENSQNTTFSAAFTDFTVYALK